MAVTLLYTNSLDGTADLVVRRLGTDSVFRVNSDLWRDYRFRIDARGFEIANPTGRTITDEDVAKVYWRKPARSRDLFPEKEITTEDAYLEEEVWYSMREIFNSLSLAGKVVLVEPRAEERAGKVVQMRAARDLFHVPTWKIVRGSSAWLESRVSVVKSLTLKRVSHSSVLYAARVPEAELDPSAPWFIQDYVEATKDVTVVFVRGALFAFELSRAAFLSRSIDWREVALDAEAGTWKPHPLPEAVESAIRKLMQRLGLDYGRLDFLHSRDGYNFLEVNPAGEWGWLDPDGAHGVLNAILQEVSPATACHPIRR